MRGLFLITAVTILFFAGTAHGAESYDCSSTPPGAVASLPPPLDAWGQIVCTQYGYVISAKKGWLWTQPGAFDPVYIPAQMVRRDPVVSGNRIYFTHLAMDKVSGDEFSSVFAIFVKGFDADKKPHAIYRLDATSSTGTAIKLYFFDFGRSKWGMWCPHRCEPGSRFMLLDMTKSIDVSK